MWIPGRFKLWLLHVHSILTLDKQLCFSENDILFLELHILDTFHSLHSNALIPIVAKLESFDLGSYLFYFV